MQKFHLSQKFLIIITGSDEKTQVLNKTFGILWENGLIDSQVLIQDQPKYWSLYTFLPFQHDCSTLSHMKLATFTPFNSTQSMTVSFNELFPKKLHNFHKCPIYIAPIHKRPHVIIHNNSDSGIQIEGIEILIIQQIAKAYNFTIVYKVGLDRDSLFMNGTATGNFKLVMYLYIIYICLCFNSKNSLFD